MNRQELSALAHTHHPICAPVGDDSVRALLDRAVPHEEARVLDLGCGSAEWLLWALTAHPRLRATGVDVSGSALERAREKAEHLGVADRLTLHQQDAAAFTSQQPYDLVLSVGAAHVFDGLLPTLAAAHSHLSPAGRVLIGDGFWERTPSPGAVDMFGELGDLAALVQSARAAGWAPVHGHVSTRGELDDYEWSWTGSTASWALDRPGHPDSAQVLAAATAHRDAWLHTYRDCFGFVCLVLRRTTAD